MRTLRSIGIIWYREVLRFSRDRLRIVTALVQPLVYLFIFGNGLSASMKAMGPGINFTKFVYPGVLGMVVLFTAMFSAISIVWDREFGFLKEVLVAPIPRASMVLGKALGGSTVSMFQGIIMLIFAPLVGIGLSVGMVARLIPIMLLLAFSITSFGILISSRIKVMESFWSVMQFFLMPMFFLSGAFFPLRNLPSWLSVLTKIDPVAYGVDPMRNVVLKTLQLPAAAFQKIGLGIVIGGTTLSVMAELGILAAFGLVMIIMAVWAISLQD